MYHNFNLVNQEFKIYMQIINIIAIIAESAGLMHNNMEFITVSNANLIFVLNVFK